MFRWFMPSKSISFMGPRLRSWLCTEVCSMWRCSIFWCSVKCLLHELWAWHPPVGTWIGVLGFLGVYVALTSDPKEMTRGKKAVWITVMFVLLGLEIKTLYQDRNEHDAAERDSRQRSEDNFREIAGGIDASIQQAKENFSVTLERSNRIFSGVNEGLARQYGGDSFGYIIFAPDFLHNSASLWLNQYGKHNLSNLSVRFVDIDLWLADPVANLEKS